ncbi:MAG: response regulator transcription factor, partial [Pseudomonadota bacterium]
MKALFVRPAGVVRPRWRAAFPQLELRAGPDQSPGDSIYWIELGAYAPGEADRMIARLLDSGAPVVALSDAPSESEAFALLASGVRGYCHVEALPDQLREVAATVAAGGLWMPPGLVQRLAELALRTAKEADQGQSATDLSDTLTRREAEVARMVGRGLNNREIAGVLGVSERTVKANLTEVFASPAWRRS